MKTYDKQGGKALAKLFGDSPCRKDMRRGKGVNQMLAGYNMVCRYKNCHWGMADATPEGSKANLFIDED